MHVYFLIHLSALGIFFFLLLNVVKVGQKNGICHCLICSSLTISNKKTLFSYVNFLLKFLL